jgi:hypothetical protein
MPAFESNWIGPAEDNVETYPEANDNQNTVQNALPTAQPVSAQPMVSPQNVTTNISPQQMQNIQNYLQSPVPNQNVMTPQQPVPAPPKRQSVFKSASGYPAAMSDGNSNDITSIFKSEWTWRIGAAAAALFLISKN